MDFSIKLIPIFLLLIYSFIIAPTIGVYQEIQVWKPRQVPSLSLLGMLKVYAFNVTWITLSFFSTIVLLPKYIFHGCSSKSVEHTMNCLAERMTGIILVSTIVGPVQIRGRDNLPPVSPPHVGDRNPADSNTHTKNIHPHKGCIFIANHSSSIDAATSYFLFRQFKWIAKKSIVYMPGIGTVMIMGGHIRLDRNSKGSKHKMYDTSHKLLQSGKNIFIFPQGTRNVSQWLPFRDGAFNIALQGGYPIVPISIEIPSTTWNSSYPLCLAWKRKIDPIVITVHPVVEVKKMNNIDSNNFAEEKDRLKKTCEDIIMGALPQFRKLG